MSELDTCPFCGHVTERLKCRQTKFIGQNEITSKKKIKWTIQVICAKCKSRGKPVTIITTDNLWRYSIFQKEGMPFILDKEIFEAVMKAIEAWNTRTQAGGG